MARTLKRSKRILNVIEIQSRGLGPITRTQQIDLFVKRLNGVNHPGRDGDNPGAWVEIAVLRSALDEKEVDFAQADPIIKKVRSLDYETLFRLVDTSLKQTGFHRFLFTTDVLFDIMYDSAKPESK